MTMKTRAAIAAVMLCGSAAAGPAVQPVRGQAS